MTAPHPPFAAVPHSLPAGTLLPLHDAEDAAAIAAMLAPQEPWRGLGYHADALACYLLRDDPGLHRFRVMREGWGAGVVCVRHPWLRGPYIELIGFAAEARGLGLGGAVVAWIEAEVRGGASNLWAFVSESNAPARRFYAARGFVEVVPVADLVAAGRVEILLRKRIG